jgi:hypothetical protein
MAFHLRAWFPSSCHVGQAGFTTGDEYLLKVKMQRIKRRYPIIRPRVLMSIREILFISSEVPV